MTHTLERLTSRGWLLVTRGSLLYCYAHIKHKNRRRAYADQTKYRLLDSEGKEIPLKPEGAAK